jgi:isoleucyl-tRNA synthetase
MTAFAEDPIVRAELEAHVREELNVKAVEPIADDSELVERTLYPLLPVIGPRHGAEVGRIMAAVKTGDWTLTDDGGAVTGGVVLAADEFSLTARPRPGHEIADEGDVLVALDTQVDDALAAEGLAREVAHRIQNLRKAAGLEISDRIAVAVAGPPEAVAQLAVHRDWLAGETLAEAVEIGPEADLADAAVRDEATLDGMSLRLALRRAG